MDLRTIAWKNGKVRIIDQTLLPRKLVYLDIKDVRKLWQAIKELKVRGAPALGVAAALGVYLGVKDSRAKTYAGFLKEFDTVARYLASSRPTARNLFWGIERASAIVRRNKARPLAAIRQELLRDAERIIEEDRRVCRGIGHNGAKLLKDKDSVLTICNAGALATIDYGTALGVIYRAHEEGKRLKVFACETRPLLQGARLTTWELKRKGIDVTLICDSMAATLMQQGRVDKVITGADRIAANGDAANKIGTYSLAVLSSFHRIPFYIAAPRSTFDPRTKTGKDIPIEQRGPREVTGLFFKECIAPQGIKVFNPAFDVTPHDLITALITEDGVMRPPFHAAIRKAFGR